MNTISGVLLNWKRPNNVERILKDWAAGGIVTEAIVWNNNPERPFRHPWAKVINAAEDLGLYTRFAAACLARSECVLIQDDDLLLPARSLGELFGAWRRDPGVLHGVFGRAPRADGSYARHILGDAEAPVVLTRVLLARRCYASEFFQHAPRFDELQREGRPYGNGEDIIFSYVVRRASGRKNRIHRLRFSELSAQHAIHARTWEAHVAHRSRVLRACEQWLRETPEDGRPAAARHSTGR